MTSNEEQTPFVEGNHEGAYDGRGNFLGNTEEPVQLQVEVPAGQDQGYRAPGGGVRLSVRERAARALPYVHELVTVPEWDDAQVEVRSIDLGTRQEMTQNLMDDEGDVDISVLEASYIIKCAFDPETGEPVFTDDDFTFVQKLPASVADRLGQPAMRLSGMAKDPEKAKDEAAKK